MDFRQLQPGGGPGPDRHLSARTSEIFRTGRFGRSSRTRDPGDVISRLIAYTLFTLAKERRGALVVFPGRETIQEWVSGGYPLDARPSIPLLRSIFDPHSPGHDGALIVEKGRFARLGVRLPVSQSQQLTDDYGTRHHAAMGLAEKSDALTVLVSEERGQVSLFLKGECGRSRMPMSSSQAIIRHWKETAAYPFVIPGGRARREMLSQMIASLALAFAFWTTLFISQGEQLEKMVTVPVEFTATPSTWFWWATRTRRSGCILPAPDPISTPSIRPF
jgi:diadenylate cyclase